MISAIEAHTPCIDGNGRGDEKGASRQFRKIGQYEAEDTVRPRAWYPYRSGFPEGLQYIPTPPPPPTLDENSGQDQRTCLTEHEHAGEGKWAGHTRQLAIGHFWQHNICCKSLQGHSHLNLFKFVSCGSQITSCRYVLTSSFAKFCAPYFQQKRDQNLTQVRDLYESKLASDGHRLFAQTQTPNVHPQRTQNLPRVLNKIWVAFIRPLGTQPALAQLSMQPRSRKLKVFSAWTIIPPQILTPQGKFATG